VAAYPGALQALHGAVEAHHGALQDHAEAMDAYPGALHAHLGAWHIYPGALHAHPDAFFKRKKLTHFVAFFAFTSRFPFHLHLSYFCFKEKRKKNFPSKKMYCFILHKIFVLLQNMFFRIILLHMYETKNNFTFERQKK
jgi:hypothetical protein